MKKNRLLLICTIVLFGISMSQAQNTGYMGKRVIFNMGTSFSPAWINPSLLHDDSDARPPWHAFNYTLSPNIEIIAWRLGTVGASYHFFKTKYFYYKETDYSTIWLDSIYDTERLADLTVHGFGVFYKQYLGSRSRAPMGTFLKLQVDGFFFKHPHSDDAPTIMDKSNLFACKIEFGHDFLFFNRLRFSTGMSLGSTFGGYKTLIDTYFEQYSVEQYAKGRILGHYWLGFTVNVGFLAF